MSSETQTVEWTSARSQRDPGPFVDSSEIFDTVQAIVGRKWHLRLVHALLEDGPMGFSELKSTVDGISSKMISESLAALEDADLVDRRLLSDRPVRVEYSLTERGEALEPVVTSMLSWGVQYGEREAEEGDE
jgi:DNA-binding HxlR family transcriptional regulator